MGTTTVTSTATDPCGNAAVLMWDVTVTASNMVAVVVELDGVTTPVVRCIRFQVDDCTSTDMSLSFTDHDASNLTPVRATAMFEMPCGEYTLLCAKDEQHSTWSTSPLSIVGADYVADATITLDGGDTDNDGDVDIDDVTLFIVQFGSLTQAADLDGNGWVDAQDVELLERRHGLSGELSKRMRTMR